MRKKSGNLLFYDIIGSVADNDKFALDMELTG